jgi:hypothetical protein
MVSAFAKAGAAEGVLVFDDPGLDEGSRGEPFVIHHSSFIIRHSSFVIHHSSFVIHHSSFVIRPLPRLLW